MVVRVKRPLTRSLNNRRSGGEPSASNTPALTCGTGHSGQVLHCGVRHTVSHQLDIGYSPTSPISYNTKVFGSPHGDKGLTVERERSIFNAQLSSLYLSLAVART